MALRMTDAQKILIVDDDKFFRTLLFDALQARYRVFEADRGDEVLSLALKVHPDLMILDIEMSGKNGIEVCRELKREPRTRNIPVILLTARTKKEDIVLGLQAGADDYLTKPMFPPEILARIDAHLRSRTYYSDLEHRDLLLLLELSEAISVCRNPMKILRLIVDKMTEVIDVARCSIVSINGAGQLVVKASSDLDREREIILDMQKYPEIRKALETRRAVVVNDIKHDPLMAPVRQYVADLDFNSIIVMPIIKKESMIGTFFLRTASPLEDGISERVCNLCHLVANFSANALENAILFESMQTAKEFLEEMAIRDGLTCLYTHRHFYDRLDEEYSRSLRYREPLSLIFFDIDDFKRINDTYGHTCGDEVLRQIGRVVRETVRESDIPTRYGGEEFAILLPNTGTDGALEMARRLGTVIRRLRFEVLPGEEITVSAGVSTFALDNLDSFHQLVKLADWAMYRAKSEGKDRVAAATDPGILSTPPPRA